ncbi:MAG: ABC transporter permease [Candidatus Hydrogenedentes bacterium]|nr:ABC transporter permease [Candidatus Hydrogenedentota bacterium]
MRKALGLIGLLAGLIALSSVWEHAHLHHSNLKFFTPENLRNLASWIGLFGILSLGQCLVIITGGIDLSVGSVVALVSILAAFGVSRFHMSPWVAFPAALLLSALIGLWHGALVTKVRMQPFVVTLCGLFLYRGIARLVSSDNTLGFSETIPGISWLSTGAISGMQIPVPFVLFLGAAAIVGGFLHLTAPGRHLFAVGANEQSARFSGIATDRVKITAYVLCSLLSGAAGLLFALKVQSMGPTNFGSFYELYAIAGVVLGGCSLRGGSGNILGVVVGAALIRVLNNLVIILEIPSQLEYVVIGGAILVGVFVDEVFSRKSHSTIASQ